MSVTFRDRYRMTLLNSPGLTGDFPLGPAYPAFQTFEAADNGLTFDVIVNDGPTAWEIRKDCTYTHSTTTLSRGTFVDSSTGSPLELSPNAIVAVTLLSQRAVPVTITTPAVADSIQFNGTDWVNGPVTAAYTEVVKHLVKNDTGVALTKGQAVYISGANGTNVLIKLAQANNDINSATTIGLLEQDLAVNGIGYVITEGKLTGTGFANLDTGTATVGDPIWLSPTTAGGLIYGFANKPYAPDHLVYLGVVTRVSTTVGEIFITVQNGYELNELHNVSTPTASLVDKNLLVYESSTSLWKNKTVTQAIGNVLNIGDNLSTFDAAIQVGQGRTGSGQSFIDLIGDTVYSDYGLRVIRAPTSNGTSQLQHRGTGDLTLLAREAASFKVSTSSTERLIVSPTGTTTITSGVLYVGNSSVSTNSCAIEVGIGRTGDGNSYIDLVGDTTYSDYGTRLIRGPGSNGNSQLLHRGTGLLQIIAQEATSITFQTATIERVSIAANGDTTFKNGIVYVGDNSISTNSCVINIGQGRTGDGNSYLDLIGDTTYTDFGTRLIRGGGANGNSQLVHRGTGNLQIIAQEAAPITFNTSNTERVRIAADGITTILNGIFNVGGSTLSTENSTINIGQGRTGDGASYLDLVSDTTYPDFGLRLIRYGGANGGAVLQHRGTGDFTVYANEAAAIKLSTSSIERVRIAANGDTTVKNGTLYVGDSSISTSDCQLNIGQGRTGAGNSYLDLVGDTTYSDYGLRAIRYSNGASEISHRGTGGFYINCNEAASMYLMTNTTTRLLINAAGNVGIGTATPGYKLEVNGTVKANNYIGSTLVNPTINFDFAGTRTLDPRIGFTRASVATYLNERGFIDYANSGVARFDFNPSTQESLGLLIEEARTNLQVHSDNLSYLSFSNVLPCANTAIAPDGRFTATKVIPTATTSQHLLQVNGANVTGTTQVLSVFAKAAELNTIVLSSWGSGDVLFTLTGNGSHNLTTPTSNFLAASITSYPNGWYRCSLTINRTSGSAFHYLGFSSTGNTLGNGYSGIYIWGLQVEDGPMPTSYIPSTYTSTGSSTTATYFNNTGTLVTALANTARYENNPTNIMVPARIVLEPSIANWARATEDFTQSLWAKTGSTVTGASGIAPDGNNTATKLADDSTTGFHGVAYYPPKTTAVTDFYTLSLFVKPVEYYSITLQADGTGLSTSVAFNLLTKTVAFGQANRAINYTIQDLPNGWFRISMTHPVTAVGTAVCFKAYMSPSSGGNYAGVTGNGMLIWGAQLEQYLSPTSYIPNSTTTGFVARGAATETTTAGARIVDVASMTGYNFYSWYNPLEGTFFIKSKAPSQYTTTFRSVLSVFSNVHLHTNIGIYRGDDNKFAVDSKVMNLTWDVDIRSSAAYTINSTNHQAVGYKYNDWAVSNNTDAIATDTSASVNPYTTLYFGQYSTFSGSQINSTIAKIVYYPKRLSNAELTALTTI